MLTEVNDPLVTWNHRLNHSHLICTTPNTVSQKRWTARVIWNSHGDIGWLWRMVTLTWAEGGCCLSDFDLFHLSDSTSQLLLTHFLSCNQHTHLHSGLTLTHLHCQSCHRARLRQTCLCNGLWILQSENHIKYCSFGRLKYFIFSCNVKKAEIFTWH